MAGKILLIISAFGLVLFGGAGVILPFLPGVPISWLGILIFGYVTGFSIITWKIIFIFLGLTVFSIILDALAPILGAKKYSASRYGIIGSFIGVVLGVAFWGPLGIVIGPLLGTFIGEILGGRGEEEAFKSAQGTLIGFLAGSAIKLVIIMAMFGYLLYGTLALLI